MTPSSTPTSDSPKLLGADALRRARGAHGLRSGVRAGIMERYDQSAKNVIQSMRG